MKALKSLICAVILTLLTAFIIWIRDAKILYNLGIDRFLIDFIETVQLIFGVIFGVLAAGCAVSAIIHAVLILIRKFTRFRPAPSGITVFLASNITLFAISGIVIFFDLTAPRTDFFDLHGLLTLLLLCSVVPVCSICIIICIVILIRRRKRP